MLISSIVFLAVLIECKYIRNAFETEWQAQHEICDLQIDPLRTDVLIARNDTKDLLVFYSDGSQLLDVVSGPKAGEIAAWDPNSISFVTVKLSENKLVAYVHAPEEQSQKVVLSRAFRGQLTDSVAYAGQITAQGAHGCLAFFDPAANGMRLYKFDQNTIKKAILVPAIFSAKPTVLNRHIFVRKSPNMIAVYNTSNFDWVSYVNLLNENDGIAETRGISPIASTFLSSTLDNEYLIIRVGTKFQVHVFDSQLSEPSKVIDTDYIGYISTNDPVLMAYCPQKHVLSVLTEDLQMIRFRKSKFQISSIPNPNDLIRVVILNTIGTRLVMIAKQCNTFKTLGYQLTPEEGF